jgi:hypothetical protein
MLGVALWLEAERAIEVEEVVLIIEEEEGLGVPVLLAEEVRDMAAEEGVLTIDGRGEGFARDLAVGVANFEGVPRAIEGRGASFGFAGMEAGGGISSGV